MARRQPAREAALEQIRARRRAAGQKVNRLAHRGVNTEHIDPRLSNSALTSMSTKQLQAHLRRLDAFTSRSTSYVAGHNGVPLSGELARRYQRAERIYNNKSDAFTKSINDLVIPTLNQTVGQYLAELRDPNRVGGSRRDGDYRTFGELRRNLSGVTSDESLKKLVAQMEKRADPNYVQKEAALQRRILNKMLRRTGNGDLVGDLSEMSDEEVITFTQYTDFMDKLSSSYAMSKSTSTDRPEWQSSVFEDNEESIRDLARWAHRHFSDQDDSEQDTDDSRTPSPAGPVRDRFGRFAKKDRSSPDPVFHRDEHGRFAPRGSGNS